MQVLPGKPKNNSTFDLAGSSNFWIDLLLNSPTRNPKTTPMIINNISLSRFQNVTYLKTEILLLIL